MTPHRIAFVGMGEAGSAIVSGWGQALSGRIRAYDIKLDDPATAPEIETRCAQLGLGCVYSPKEALDGAALVFSCVTPDQAVPAARAAAGAIGLGTLWCDLNSCAPGSKREAAGLIEAAGGRYVDVAVMAPVHPKRNMVPLLVSGPHAEEAAQVLAALPMAPRVVPGEVGRASAIKMIRSVMVKGLEALTAECVLAAVAAGVEDEVLPSLAKGHPRLDVAQRAAYNFERSLTHGTRRAAEMEEVARTLAELGLPNGMSQATSDWQQQLGRIGADVATGDDYRDIAEQVLALWGATRPAD